MRDVRDPSVSFADTSPYAGEAFAPPNASAYKNHLSLRNINNMNTMVKTRINTGVLHDVHLLDKKNIMVF